MSNDKLAASFHPGDEPAKPVGTSDEPANETPETLHVPGTVHMKPDDPTAIPHAHMDEH